jgi:hypothetical protein
MEWEQIRNLHAKLNNLSVRNNWSSLEKEFCDIAQELSGPNIARLIMSINMTRYSNSLSKLLRKGIQEALKQAAEAIYFEYDIDNNWSSNLFIHAVYKPEYRMDDDWACDWIDSLKGPSFPLFTQIYRMYGGFHVENDNEVGTTFYLLARTIAAFGKAAEKISSSDLAICIGYHDQTIVTRIRETNTLSH